MTREFGRNPVRALFGPWGVAEPDPQPYMLIARVFRQSTDIPSRPDPTRVACAQLAVDPRVFVCGN